MKCLPKGITNASCKNVGIPPLQKTIFLLLFFSAYCSFSTFAQTVITGKITSGDSVLTNATVQVKGGKSKTQTDASGHFSINALPGATLVVSYVGYATREIKVNNQAVVNVELQSLANQMTDVVVVGYGRQRAPTVTGSIGVISGKELSQTPVANITNMLIGRTAGVSGIQAGGEPGTNSATIRIRGVATLNGQDPLVVIDGIQQPAERPFVQLNAMDANEIENVSILKDASATAVYGIRGANGVIIVTTKRGRASRPQFSFSANEGFTKANSLFKTVNSFDYATLRNEAIRNAQTAGDRTNDALLFTDDELWKFKNNRDYTPQEVAAMNLTDAQKAALNNSPALFYSSHNYYEEQFGGTGRQSQYNLNVSGGSDKVRYFTSLGYFNQNGILSNASYGGSNTNPNFRRYNFRSNFDIDVAPNFLLSFNLGGQSSVNRIVGASASTDFGNRYQAIVQGILENSPFVGPGIVDGHLVTSFIGENGSPTNPLGAKSGSGASPFSGLLTGGTRTVNTTTLSSVVTLKHTMNYLVQGLDAHVRLAYDDNYVKGFLQTNSVPTYSAMRDPANPAKIIFIGGQINPSTASDNQQNSAWRKLYLEAAVNYNHRFGDHTVSGLFLANAQRYTQNGQELNTPSGLMGLVSRVTYNFKERYMLEFSAGLNGTENFAKGKRFGYFPAVSGGWNISNESFFKKNRWVTFAKLRGSYGEVGNDQIGGRRYLYLPNSWGSGASYYFGSNNSSANPSYGGAAESKLGNPDVTWERAKKVNVSVDLRLLNDKLSLTGSWFQEKRNNILVTSGVIPGTFGVPASNTAPLNMGRVSNKGFEIEAGWNDNIGKVSYFLKGNFSFAKNRIDFRAEAPFPYPWMNATGYSIGQYKGLLTDGFYNTKEDLLNRPYNNLGGNNARLGDLKFRDITGEGIINEQDMVPIGYSNLPQVAYNLSVGFAYKGFDVSALFIGTARGSFPQFDYILSSPFALNKGTALQYMFDGRWTAEKYASGQPISYPAITLGSGNSQANNNKLSDFYLRSNNFQRLKNLEIGYSFRQQEGLLRRAGVKGLRLYANGNNLFTWGSNLIDGIDPEQADAGKNSSGYLFPLTRTYNMGLNIQF
jgi:TonB-linked SusC/RagA family outer membrane protein